MNKEIVLRFIQEGMKFNHVDKVLFDWSPMMMRVTFILPDGNKYMWEMEATHQDATMFVNFFEKAADWIKVKGEGEVGEYQGFGGLVKK